MDTNHQFNLKINKKLLKKQCQRIFIVGILFFIIFSMYVPVTASDPDTAKWNLTITATSKTGKIDYVVIGEALTASDGAPYDSFDVPKTIPPLTPYLRCWLDDNLIEPYHQLWKDYRKFQDSQKTWNLTVQWVPDDNVSTTDITFTWNRLLLTSSEYNSINLCDEMGKVLQNMLKTNAYSFSSQASTPKYFTINAAYVEQSGGNTGGSSGGGGSSNPVDLIPPVGIADGPYEGVIQEVVDFDASQSYDSDGSITLYRWDFGDNSLGEGKTSSHKYSAAGNYSITLTVTDNDGQTAIFTTYAIIVSSTNLPSSMLDIHGKQVGSVNISYTYTITIQDMDDSIVKGSINWDDGVAEENLTLSIQEPTLLLHQWEQFGIYTIRVTASDTVTTISKNLTIYIDTYVLPNDPSLNISGYLIDRNSDTVFDSFYNSKLDTANGVKQENGSIYLLDTDLDNIWDIRFDLETNQHSAYTQENTDSEERQIFLFLLTLIAIIMIVSAFFIYRFYAHKRILQKKITSKKRVTQKR